MKRPAIAFLGGNGHASVRLEAARAAWRARGSDVDVRDFPYPAVDDFDELLARLAHELMEWGQDHPDAPVYATGIGGLVALALRARGDLLARPLILQGAVLWGLETRTFPKLMRLPGMTRLLAGAFRLDFVRSHFETKHLQRPLSSDAREQFFAGYADAARFAAWFRWLTPALLRRLERELPARPAALDRIEFWWGERDTVVGVDELRLTERALDRTFPLRSFPTWGHYPMLDEPDAWSQEVERVLETACALS